MAVVMVVVMAVVVRAVGVMAAVAAETMAAEAKVVVAMAAVAKVVVALAAATVVESERSRIGSRSLRSHSLSCTPRTQSRGLRRRRFPRCRPRAMP